MEGRTRLHCAIIHAVREAIGQDYIVAIRFCACDYMKGCSQIAEIPEAVSRFVSTRVDLIDISGGLSGYMVRGASQPGWFAELSRPAKETVNVPVLLTVGIQTGQDAGWSERAIHSSH